MLEGGSRPTDGLPFVSIITVVFNSQDYLEKTIQSIIHQTSPRYELIVIDGGSTDRTVEIIHKYNNSINYWSSEPDKGIYDAMNKGIRKAKGEYLWFINSGDEVNAADTLQDIIEAKSVADIYYGESILINTSGKILGERSQLSTRKLPEKLNWESFRLGMTVSHQSILVRRSLAPFYNIEYRCSADIDWVISSLKESHLIVKCDFPLSKYLVGGFSLRNVKKCWKERFRIFEKHYGKIPNLANHLLIGIRFLFFKMMQKENF